MAGSRTFLAVVRDLIRAEPGRSSRYYAETALRRGLCGSTAIDEIVSLGTTLDKVVREKRFPGVRRERVDGGYKYFLVEARTPADPSSPEALRVDLRLPPELAKRVVDLIEIRQFTTPSDAALWLLTQGVMANVEALDRVALETEAIRERRESAKKLLGARSEPSAQTLGAK